MLKTTTDVLATRGEDRLYLNQVRSGEFVHLTQEILSLPIFSTVTILRYHRGIVHVRNAVDDHARNSFDGGEATLKLSWCDVHVNGKDRDGRVHHDELSARYTVLYEKCAV